MQSPILTKINLFTTFTIKMLQSGYEVRLIKTWPVCTGHRTTDTADPSNDRVKNCTITLLRHRQHQFLGKKDTCQGIHLALYWLQHPSLWSHIFFCCHGNAGERKRIKLLVLRIIQSSQKRRTSRQCFFRGQWMGWSNMNEITIFPLISIFYS